MCRPTYSSILNILNKTINILIKAISRNLAMQNLISVLSEKFHISTKGRQQINVDKRVDKRDILLHMF